MNNVEASQLVSMKGLCKKYDRSRATMYRLIDKDPTFPQKVPFLGGGTAARWLLSEIEEHIAAPAANRPQQSVDRADEKPDENVNDSANADASGNGKKPPRLNARTVAMSSPKKKPNSIIIQRHDGEIDHSDVKRERGFGFEGYPALAAKEAAEQDALIEELDRKKRARNERQQFGGSGL